MIWWKRIKGCIDISNNLISYYENNLLKNKKIETIGNNNIFKINISNETIEFRNKIKQYTSQWEWWNTLYWNEFWNYLNSDNVSSKFWNKYQPNWPNRYAKKNPNKIFDISNPQIANQTKSWKYSFLIGKNWQVNLWLIENWSEIWVKHTHLYENNMWWIKMVWEIEINIDNTISFNFDSWTMNYVARKWNVKNIVNSSSDAEIMSQNTYNIFKEIFWNKYKYKHKRDNQIDNILYK